MLHRITGRAVKCGPAAISAIAGVPTHEATAVICRLFDRPAANGVFMDELAAALGVFGRGPDYALRHPKFRERRFARREELWEHIFADVPFDVRAVTLGTFLDAAPAGMWAISAGGHFVAYADGFVADSGAWFSRKPAFWSRPNPDHDLLATALKCAYSLKSAGRCPLDVELGTWGRDASSRSAAPTLRFGPSGDAPQPQVRWAFHGQKGASGHGGRTREIKRLSVVKYHI